MLERLFRLILPSPLLEDENEMRISRFIVLITATVSIFLACATPVIIFFYQQQLLGWLMLGAALYFGLCLVLPKLTHTWRATSLALVGGVLLFLLVLIIVYYPERMLFYVWFPFTIVLATFGLGRRWGAILVVFWPRWCGKWSCCSTGRSSFRNLHLATPMRWRFRSRSRSF